MLKQTQQGRSCATRVVIDQSGGRTCMPASSARYHQSICDGSHQDRPQLQAGMACSLSCMVVSEHVACSSLST